MPVSQDFLPEFALHAISPFTSLAPSFDDCFTHTSEGVASPSITTPPLYSFELDAADIRLATGGGSNDTLTEKGFYHDKTE
jgi:hypothetical protein